MSNAQGRAKKGLLIGLGVLGLVVIGLGVWLGPVLGAFYREGFFEQTPERKHSGNSLENLKAIHTALMLYHDSEGQFPAASGWMDAALPRLKTADMPEEEARKKLVRPDLLEQAGTYGYALNRAVEQKFVDDIADAEQAILVFESMETNWNAAGNPETDGNAGPKTLAVTISGSVVEVGSRTPGSDRP